MLPRQLPLVPVELLFRLRVAVRVVMVAIRYLAHSRLSVEVVEAFMVAARAIMAVPVEVLAVMVLLLVVLALPGKVIMVVEKPSLLPKDEMVEVVVPAVLALTLRQVHLVLVALVKVQISPALR